MSRQDHLVGAFTATAADESVAMPSDAFGVLLLPTDVDAMSEGGTPAFLHVSLDPSTFVLPPSSTATPSSSSANAGGQETLLNKMLIGAFSTCLKRKRGMLLETLVRRLARRDGTVDGGKGHNGFVQAVRRVSIGGACTADPFGTELSDILQDTFTWDLEHGRCCVAGLVAAAPNNEEAGSAPLLLCLLLPAGTAYALAPLMTVFKSILLVLDQHVAQVSSTSTPQSLGIVEYIHQCVAALHSTHVPAAAVDAAAAAAAAADTTAAVSPSMLRESFAACKRQLFQLLSATATAGAQLERLSRAQEFASAVSGGGGRHNQPVHHVAEWWGALHRMLLLSQQQTGGQDEDDMNRDDGGVGIEDTLRRHAFSSNALLRSDQRKDASIAFSHSPPLPPASEPRQRYAIKGVAVWTCGQAVHGAPALIDQCKPFLLLYAADCSDTREWSSAAPQSHVGQLGISSSRWQTPFVRAYRSVRSHNDGKNVLFPHGFVAAVRPTNNASDVVLVGTLGTTFVCLRLVALAGITTYASIGCTELDATVAVSRSLYDLRDGVVSGLTGGLTQHVWPRSSASLTLKAADVVSPIGFEVRVLCKGNHSSNTTTTTHLAAAYLRNAADYTLAPLSAYIDDAKEWLSSLQSSAAPATAFTVRRHVPLVHRRLQHAAASVSDDTDGSTRSDRTATLLMEAFTSSGSSIVCVVLLMPSSTPVSVAKTFSSALIARFAEDF